MEIRHTAETLFTKRYAKFRERVLNPENQKDFFIDNHLIFGIYKNAENFSITAKIRWFLPDEEHKEFPCTEEGLTQAMNWLDMKRLERISKLL